MTKIEALQENSFLKKDRSTSAGPLVHNDFVPVQDLAKTTLTTDNQSQNIEIPVIDANAATRAIVTSDGESAAVRDDDQAIIFKLTINESEHRQEVVIGTGTIESIGTMGSVLRIGESTASTRRLQTNQALGIGLTENKVPFIVETSHGKDPALYTLDPNNDWVNSAVPNESHWSRVTAIISLNHTLTAEIIQRVSSETHGQALGVKKVFALASEVSNPIIPKSKIGFEPKEFKLIQEAARRYYLALPDLTEAESKSIIDDAGLTTKPLTKEVVRTQLPLASGVFNVEGLQYVMTYLAALPEDKQEYAEYVLRSVIPQLVCLMSPNTQGKYAENHAASMRTAIARMINGVKIGKLDAFSVLCPSYNYEVWGQKLDKNASLRHLDGQILPTIGIRYSPTAKTMERLLGGLAAYYPEGGISYYVYTYDGIQGAEGLWEMGQDVLDYYRGQQDGQEIMSKNLQSAFTQLQGETKSAFTNSPAQANVVSIEEAFVGELAQVYGDFCEQFPGIKQIDPKTTEYQKIDEFLKARLGIGVGWLEYFYQEEVRYANKQGVAEEEDRALDNAFRESLLYLITQRKAAEPDSILLGLETTANYMVGSLPEVSKSMGPVGVIMAKPFNPADPDGFGIRQPFNRPTYSIQPNDIEK